MSAELANRAALDIAVCCGDGDSVAVGAVACEPLCRSADETVVSGVLTGEELGMIWLLLDSVFTPAAVGGVSVQPRSQMNPITAAPPTIIAISANS